MYCIKDGSNVNIHSRRRQRLWVQPSARAHETSDVQEEESMTPTSGGERCTIKDDTVLDEWPLASTLVAELREHSACGKPA